MLRNLFVASCLFIVPSLSFSTPTIALQNPSTTSNPSAKIRPYRAHYNIAYKGINSVLKRSLKQTNSVYWELNNSISLLLFGSTEQAIFKIQNDQIIPLAYKFDNDLNNKKNSKLTFNWRNSTVTETKRKLNLTISPETRDVLSFQLQLRLDLLHSGDNFTDKTYTLIDKKRLKEYTVKFIGEETLTTPAGKFNAVKIEQRRVGKSDFTHIWLAKNMDYFLVKIERIEDNRATYTLEINDVKIDGVPLISR